MEAIRIHRYEDREQAVSSPRELAYALEMLQLARDTQKNRNRLASVYLVCIDKRYSRSQQVSDGAAAYTPAPTSRPDDFWVRANAFQNFTVAIGIKILRMFFFFFFFVCELLSGCFQSHLKWRKESQIQNKLWLSWKLMRRVVMFPKNEGQVKTLKDSYSLCSLP